MRLPRFNNRYSGLPRDETDATRLDIHNSSTSPLNNTDVEIQDDPLVSSVDNIDLPPDPPNYDDLQDIDPMDIDIINVDSDTSNFYINRCNIRSKLNHYINNINDNVIIPVRLNVMDPLTQLYYHIQERIDFYLNKIGNPIILRRLFYIILMSMIAFYVMSSGLMPSNRSPHFGEMFSDHELLIQYAKQSMDLAKLETDLEYISSMQHSSGTKGDVAISRYIEESMDANNLKIIKEFTYSAYSDYATGNSTLNLILQNGEQINIPLNENNFNPLSPSGHLNGVNVVYGYKGKQKDLDNLKQNGFLDSDFILLLKYDVFPNEQILLAQQYGAKAILFISDGDQDLIQQVSVSLPQFGTGDILTPGYSGPLIDVIDVSEAKYIAKIPILPLSFNQGQKILKYVQNDGIQFEDNEYSGGSDPLNGIKVDLKVDVAFKERQPVFDIIGKIEGREQDDKAIVIAASRNSVNYGARYPGFGTSVLLSLIQLCQEMKYKYDWKPLRNVYFISFGGNEFNYAGATELIEERTRVLRDEVYSFIDISQLGVWDDSAKDINIQTHPLLSNFYRNVIPTHGFNINIEHIQQYGDWIPYLANGIPSTIISNPSVKDKKLPINTKNDTFDSIKSLLHDSSREEIIEELLLYIFEVILKLSDYPYIQFDLTNFGDTMLDVLHNFQNEINYKLNTDSVEESLVFWKRIGLEWEAWTRSWNHIVMVQDGIEPSLVSVGRWTWNRKLSNIGRRQLFLEGLPNRNFYKNVLFSPTMWTGDYGNGHWTFPGVRDAIDQDDWEMAQKQMDIVADVLKKSAEMFIEENDEDNIYK